MSGGPGALAPGRAATLRGWVDVYERAGIVAAGAPSASASAARRSAGSGEETSISAPVSGCARRRRAECRNCLCRPSRPGVPYSGSPAHRVPDRLHVHAHLMRASRVEAQPQQRIPRERSLEREMGARAACGVAAHRHARARARVSADRRLHGARARRRPALHERKVLARYLASRERALEQRVDLVAARHQHQARGVAIEAVHDPRALRVNAARGDPGEQLRQRALLVAPPGVHDEARRLVHHQQVLILVCESHLADLRPPLHRRRSPRAPRAPRAARHLHGPPAGSAGSRRS